MALTFPSSPTNGQVYTDTVTGNRYVYDSSKGLWKFSANSVGVTVGTAPPPANTVAPGAMWYNTNTGRTFIYYDDGDSKQWVENIPASNIDTNTIAGYVNPVFASMNGAYTTANAGYGTANSGYVVANAAFGKANTALQNTTGTFAGNLTVTGNVVFSDASTIGTASSLGMRNRLINGDMRIWQRGTSTANTTSYTADRWFVNRNGGVSGVTVSQSGTAGNYYMKIQRNANDTQTNNFDLRQVIETQNCADLAGKTVTLSFIGYVGTNNTNGSVTLELRSSTATDDGVNVTGSWSVTGQSTSIALTTTPTKYSLTIAVPSNALTLMFRIFGSSYSGTAGADDSVYITQTQLEAGSVVTPFERRPYGQELSLCQRYYWQPANAISPNGMTDASGRIIVNFKLPVTMRTNPSFTLTRYNTRGYDAFLVWPASSTTVATSLTFNFGATIDAQPDTVGIIFAGTQNSTAGYLNLGQDSYIKFSAEL